VTNWNIEAEKVWINGLTVTLDKRGHKKHPLCQAYLVKGGYALMPMMILRPYRIKVIDRKDRLKSFWESCNALIGRVNKWMELGASPYGVERLGEMVRPLINDF
jgi:hypothetical protein